jgi:malonyl-CoA O-methyltransferase
VWLVASNHDNSVDLDLAQIARQFSRAAKTYDRVAQLQQTMSDRLIAKLPPSATGQLVDFGCGTGSSLLALADSRNLSLAGFDLSESMIEVATQKRSQKADDSIRLWVADISRSGLTNASIDVVFSNAAIQWSDLRSVFTEMFRVLKPKGQLLISTFGPKTMMELQQAWKAIGDESPRVHRFPSAEEIREALHESGFIVSTIESEVVGLTYPSLRELFLSIKHLGATNASAHRNRGLLGREKFKHFCQCLNQRKVDGMFRLQFEPIYVTATRM